MKGIVFTEFLGMVGARFGEDMVDDLILESGVASAGVYTSVGTYPHSEIVKLVGTLAALTETPAPKLVHAFGAHLFGRFAQIYTHFFENIDTAPVFLSRIESVIHVEVLKLYPDAELPRFDVEQFSGSEIVLRYESARQMSDLAHGLIDGCIEHFGTPMAVIRENLPPKGQIEVTRFRVISPKNAV